MKIRIKQIIILILFQLIIKNILSAAGSVKSTITDGGIFSSATLVCQSKAYICDISVALDPDYQAAEALANDYPIPWIDIAQYITPVHCARGYIDLFVQIDMGNIGKLATGTVPSMYLYGDPDDRSNHDLAVSADNALYDMIDTDYKGVWDTDVLGVTISSLQYVSLRFAVPPEPPKTYKLFLGQDNLRPVRSATSYSDRYVVKVFTPAISTGVFACPDVLVPRRYKIDYDTSNHIFKVPALVRYITKNVPVMFDGSRSVVTSSATINTYEWDFDNDGVYDAKGVNPVYIYTSTGTYTVILRVTSSDSLISVSSGSVRAVAGSVPLPLTVQVVEAPTVGKLFQNAPNPFVTSKKAYTTISYDIAENAFVSLKIYTASGELVKTLVEESKLAGLYDVNWDGTNQSGESVASGVYIYHIKAGDLKASKILAVVK
ncbi:MAG: hypothetical protein A2539_01470 [Elusimicrobia bacterium RIFOXYD2_FULL_34_15]|nr:MAG: hypothetical protein A2539_01470 [Elusimicrobia bacterium RIFOXYD2_FULL_34_15]